MIIRVYIDGDATPVAELAGSSGRIKLDTTAIPDGVHRLRIETIDGDRVTGRREIAFTVRNGPGIAVAGLSERDEVRCDLSRKMRGLPRRRRPGTHCPVGDAGRAGHLSASCRPARGLSLPPALELCPWLALERRDAAHGGWPDRGGLGRHRRASGA